jgi:glyoxylase-like metal-dependent hydrolase (beta-lactamase superfamily II)
MIHTIHTLDHHFLNMPEVIATYAIVGEKSAAIIETGPASTLNTILESLRSLGVQPKDVRDVLVTHIHFDHAGASWWWAKQGATIHVHPNGAPHLIDPSKLIASATRLYKDQMDFLWGKIEPVPTNQVHIVNDGDTVEAAGVILKAIDTPGHAKHHHAYQLGDAAFTGDVSGVHLPDFDWTAVPAPPPEFDMEAWEATLKKLAAFNFNTIYPTHYGAIHNPNEHLSKLAPLVRACAEFVRDRMNEGLTRDQIVPIYMEWNAQRCTARDKERNAVERYMGANNQDLSVDGMMRYWSKKADSK